MNDPELDRAQARPQKRFPIVALALLILAGIAGFFGWQRREVQLDAKEQLAKEAIESHGGLFVMDAKREHPATLNLASLTDDSLDQVIKDAQSLRRLKIFDLTGKPITDGHAGQIAELGRLTSLHVSGTQIGDAGLQKLKRLSNLQTLLIANTNVTDSGVAHLGEMPSLIVLDLSGNRLTGDLASLASLPKLQWLLIREVPLGPAALDNLGAIKSLRRLTTSENALDDESVQQLKKLNPELSVE